MQFTLVFYGIIAVVVLYVLGWSLNAPWILPAVAALGGLLYWFDRRRVGQWPKAEGTIESAATLKIEEAVGTVTRQDLSVWGNDIVYSFTVDNVSYSGSFVREARDHDDAWEYSQAAPGIKVPVRYHPRKPRVNRVRAD